MYQKKQYLGRIVECMFCQEQIKFAVLSGMSLPLVYFYAASNNDVLMRADWALSVISTIESRASDLEIESLCEKFLASSVCDVNKNFAIWNNVKCPKCKVEFPYRFKGNLKLRLTDPAIILIDGCTVDSDQGTYVVDVVF